MNPDLAAALQKNEKLSKEVLLLRDAIDRSNEALEHAIKIQEERNALRKLATVVLRVWRCTCNHDRTKRTFTCNCCVIRYELEDLGLVEKPVRRTENNGDCVKCGWNGDRDEANADGSPPAVWSRSMHQTDDGLPICSHCKDQ